MDLRESFRSTGSFGSLSNARCSALGTAGEWIVLRVEKRSIPLLSSIGSRWATIGRAPKEFRTFNEFFYRELSPGARPIAKDEDIASFPADGRHLAIPDLSKVERIYAKGQSFDLQGFLGSAEQAEQFAGGSLVISRLCPVDYHRFHSPVAGRLIQIKQIPGPLYSVSPIALRNRMSYLWSNKRVLALIESQEFGRVAFVAIGATCVGRIHMSVQKGDNLGKGDELGYFAFGGSCVATIFEKGRVQLAEDLISHSANSTEVYAKMGDVLGARNS